MDRRIKLIMTCSTQSEIIIPKHNGAMHGGKSAECFISVVDELFNRFTFGKIADKYAIPHKRSAGMQPQRGYSGTCSLLLLSIIVGTSHCEAFEQLSVTNGKSYPLSCPVLFSWRGTLHAVVAD